MSAFMGLVACGDCLVEVIDVEETSVNSVKVSWTSSLGSSEKWVSDGSWFYVPDNSKVTVTVTPKTGYAQGRFKVSGTGTSTPVLRGTYLSERTFSLGIGVTMTLEMVYATKQGASPDAAIWLNWDAIPEHAVLRAQFNRRDNGNPYDFTAIGPVKRGNCSVAANEQGGALTVEAAEGYELKGFYVCPVRGNEAVKEESDFYTYRTVHYYESVYV